MEGMFCIYGVVEFLGFHDTRMRLTGDMHTRHGNNSIEHELCLSFVIEL